MYTRPSEHEFDFLADMATAAEQGSLANARRGLSLGMIFKEPSTRTRLSFRKAATELGMEVLELSAAESSMAKGESLLDTVETLEALGCGVIVVRSPEDDALDAIQQRINYPETGQVISAGNGKLGHPTQALGDAVTARRLFGGSLLGRKIVFIGDVAHARVAKSGIELFNTLGADVWACMPKDSCVNSDVMASYITCDPVEAVANADIIYTFRPQVERHIEPDNAYVYPAEWGGNWPDQYKAHMLLSLHPYRVTAKLLRYASPGAAVFHPGPATDQEIELEVLKGIQCYAAAQVYWGVWTRAALLYLMTKG